MSADYPHPLLPFKSHFINIAGYRWHYIDEGSGPVVLLLHGNPTWSFYYRNIIDKLRSDFRVIAPDFLGMGLSDHPRAVHFRASERIAHLEEFIDKLEIDTFSMVMHDWGGAIGTGMAVGRPEKVQRLVYLNTTLTETEALPPLIKMAASPVIGKFLTKYTKQFLRFATKLGVARKLPKAVRDGYYAPYRSVSRREAIWGFVDDIPFDSSHPSYASMLRLAEKLPSLNKHPVEIIWGLRDPCFHREMLDKVARHFPNALVYEIPEASHLVLEDAPDLCARLIREFLLGEQPLLDLSQSSTQTDENQNEPNAFYEEFLKIGEDLRNRPGAIEPLFLGDSVRYGHTTFAELRDRIRKYERGLTDLGLRSGDTVLMLVPAGVEFLALSYAVMGRGAIPVFIDPGIGRDRLFDCVRDLKPDVFIGSPRAQLLRLKAKDLFPNLRFHLTASDWVYTGGPRLNFLKRFSSKELPPAPSTGTAFVAFTSGATGVPKGVVFTNAMVRAQLVLFRDRFGLQPGTRDLPLLPIFSVYHLALGVCSVFPAIDSSRPLSLSPQRVLRVIHDLQVDSSFGSPTLWKKISEYCVRAGENLGPLKRIFMAGAPVPPAVLERTREVLVKEGKIFTPYGATEALPVTLVEAEEILSNPATLAQDGEAGTFVGKPVEGVDVRVVLPEDGPMKELHECAPREIGEIVVRGPNVSKEYLNRSEATEFAKVQRGSAFWHRMGDMGYLDASGALYFCGRKAHVVCAPSRTYYSIPTEAIFNAHEMVRRSALVNLGDGQEPGIVIEPHPQNWPESDKARGEFLKELEALSASHPITENIRWIFFHPSFPVDARHNAKIFRDQLSSWAQGQLLVQQVA